MKTIEKIAQSKTIHFVFFSLFLLAFSVIGLVEAATVQVIIPSQTITIEVPDPLPAAHEHTLPVHSHALPEHIHEYAPVPPVVDPVDPLVGQAHLTWTMPATRADGSPLASTEIAGYKISYDCTNGYANTIDTVNYADPLALEYTTNTMPVGETCGFEVTVYDLAGLESVKSNRVEKLIQ